MLKQGSYRIIGMMSGTSLDGIDLAFCEFTFCKKWSFALIAAKTYPYTHGVVGLIEKMQSPTTSFLAFKSAEIEYSEYLASVIDEFIQEHHIQDVDYVSIHGHTIFHQPQSKITVQITNLATVAARLKLNVIGNFRQLDVMNGGEGAPLAPYGEQLFEGEAYLNLGGICNIGVGYNGWDINYCNLFFNYYAKVLQNVQFDRDGEIGRKGHSNISVRQYLLNSFVNQRNKSLGRQGFEVMVQTLNKNFDSLPKQDIVRTFYEFLAGEINRNVLLVRSPNQQEQQSNNERLIRVLCTGGGAKNKFLLELMRAQAKNVEYVLPHQDIIDFKEAIIFAYLGLKFIQGIKNCSSGVGGQLVKGASIHIRN